MQNKFFLDANYNVKMLSNIQRPFDDIWLWNNLIIFWIDADSTANQYLYVDYGENQTVTLAVEPGEINEIMLNSDYYWTYGGVTHVTPYKNGIALTAKKINITFPDVVENCGTLSSTESNADGSIKLGNNYEMAGSYYPTAESIKEVDDKVNTVEESVENISGDVSDLSGTVSDLDIAVGGLETAVTDLQGLITISSQDIIAGVTPLPSGHLYLVYETANQGT